MNDDPAVGIRGGMVPSARRLYLVSTIVSLPLLALSVYSGVRHIASEYEDGNAANAIVLVIVAGVLIALVFILVVALILHMRATLSEVRRRFALLRSTFPDDLVFMVNYPLVVASADSPAMWRGIRRRDVDAVVVGNAQVRVVRIRDAVDVVALADHATFTVRLSTRNIMQAEMSQIGIRAQSAELDVTIGVLPIHVRAFANPAASTLGELVLSVATRLVGARDDA